MLPSSLVYFPLNVHRVGPGPPCWLRPVQHNCWLPDSLQGIPDKHWFPVVEGPFVTTSLSVIKYCLLFLSPLVSFLVKVTIWVFGLQYGHQVESCGISIRLCKGICSPPVPFSRVICRYQLLFPLGCLLDGDMGNYSAV